jgi:hypothetical protein
MDSFATLFAVTSNISDSEPIHSTPIDADGQPTSGVACIVA